MHPSGCPLTKSQLEVLRLIAVEGLTVEQIAERRCASQSTIRSHIQGALQRLKVVNQTQAAVACVRGGWITMPGLSSPESVLMERIERLLGELVEAIEDRNERLPLNERQRAYLDAFFGYLRARAHERDERRDVMVERLGFVLREANVKYP